ncbi:OprD family porin [Halopseudomonas yangmingensis]|uniref:Outer membrane porin, OprD family n=1 Tax=Halopseudomonas yangmingensis TaxID=1720063 RepID=A0A1I4P7L0_9GAMM|nr:OprD family porin [Halopseudomonas yangmingensis]SFM23353.1 outer membrane porin, OprD family [Halopseudomonas yangmingensis]
MKNTLLAGAVASALTTLSIPALAGNGFISDSKANLALRNFYINQDNRSGSAAPSKSEEWGQGFLLDLRSGYTPGTVGFGLDATGQLGIRLDSGGRTDKPGRDRNPGAVFPLDSDNSAVSEFGRLDLTAKARLSDTELRAGALLPKLPVLTYNDGRLLPQTFRGVQLVSNDIERLTLHLGQIERASGRASSDYENLRIAGGTERVNQFRYAGGDYRLSDNLTTSYYFAELQDYYRQHYLGAVHSTTLGGGKLSTDLRYFDSNAHGANRRNQAGYGASGFNNNGEVDNRAASLLFSYSQSGHSAGFGYQHLSGDSHFPFVNNGDGATAYLITDSQIGKFQRAGERTWLARYAYDFAQAGIPGLRANATYLRGSNVNTNVSGADNEWERDLRIDYSIQSGPLKNLGLSVRHASLRSNVVGQRDQDEVRAIISYNLVLL